MFKIEDKIANLQRFRTEEVTEQDVIDSLMSRYRWHKLTDKDGVLMKPRGCSGICACIGTCLELVPADELDMLDNQQYEERLNKIKSLIYSSR